MYPFATTSHAELQKLADQAQGAAYRRDAGRVECSAFALFEALVDHVLDERRTFLHLAPAEARLLERGQQRIVELLVDLATSAALHPEACSCGRIATELVAEIDMQIDDERRYLPAPTRDRMILGSSPRITREEQR